MKSDMDKKWILPLLVLLSGCLTPVFGQKAGIKTNLLYDATSTINLGAEIALGRRVTLDVSGNKMFGSVESRPMLDHRYQGWLAGGGLTYGYQWLLGRHWNLEASIGVGYAYLDYDKYLCHKCGRRIGADSRHYFGPTKAAISLIYLF